MTAKGLMVMEEMGIRIHEHTEAEKNKGTVKSFLVKVAENSFVGPPDLLKGRKDDKQGTSDLFSTFIRLLHGRNCLIIVPSSGRTYCCRSGETAREDQVDTRREENGR